MFYAAKLINDYQTAKNFYVKFISVCINKLPSPSGGAGGGLLNHHSCSTGGYHQHRVALSDGLVVDVDAHNGIGAHLAGTVFHFLHRGVLGLAQHPFVGT